MPSTSSNYKLIIPKDVESKIRYLQNKFPTVEWSGILFYTHSGSFKEGLTITCKDIYPMDLGTSTYTEFFMSEDVASYIAKNTDTLWDCELGLIHSHNTMATFFSGTDTATLQSEGNDTNNFVSLIVNNEGTYSAAITRKVTVSTSTKEEGSYKEWGEDENHSYNNTNSNQETVIQYFMLEIEKESIISQYKEIDERFDEIQKLKASRAAAVKKPQQLNLFTPENKKEQDELWELNDGKVTPAFDPLILHDTIAKMLLCSFIVDTSKIDLDKWVVKHMVSLYDKTFGNSDSMMFREYVDFIVSFSIDYFKIEATPEAIAYALKNELLNYQSDDNPYIEVFIESFNAYTDLYE